MARRNPLLPTGIGPVDIPYDQSGGATMPGMEIPQPGGTMKKMQFEFTDPAEAAAQGPQIPPGAGVPPAGAQGAIPPAGMQAPPEQAPPMGMPQGGGGGLLEGLAQPQGQSDSSMFTDEQLASMVQETPEELEGEQLYDQLMAPEYQPDEDMQMRMMMAARRMGGF